jgi:hypothetical protein
MRPSGRILRSGRPAGTEFTQRHSRKGRNGVAGGRAW